jgi:hypothetical protein
MCFWSILTYAEKIYLTTYITFFGPRSDQKGPDLTGSGSGYGSATLEDTVTVMYCNLISEVQDVLSEMRNTGQSTCM